VIEDPPEGGLDIIAMLQDFFGGMGDSCVPKSAKMVSKSMLVENGWAFFSVSWAGFWTVGAVNTDSPLSFPHSPLEGSQNETLYEVDDKTGKLDVERFGFFLDKFGLNACMICSNGWVIVIIIMSRNFGCRSSEGALEGNAFGTDTECSWVVWYGIIRRERAGGRP
jgi:hypothetical protein